MQTLTEARALHKVGEGAWQERCTAVGLMRAKVHSILLMRHALECALCLLIVMHSILSANAQTLYSTCRCSSVLTGVCETPKFSVTL
jgi:hypothetical protein